jgi:hypothetical protein
VGPRAGLDDVENRIFLTLPGLEMSKDVRILEGKIKWESHGRRERRFILSDEKA